MEVPQNIKNRNIKRSSNPTSGTLSCSTAKTWKQPAYLSMDEWIKKMRYVCVCVCVHTCVYVYACMHVCVYIYIYICAYIYVHIYIYIYIYIYIHKETERERLFIHEKEGNTAV